jgi:hypothetical protein
MNLYQDSNPHPNLKLIKQFQVNNADSHLDSLATKLVNVEKNLIEKPIENPEEGVDMGTVMELFESVTDVTSEYQTLKKDLQEVQQLQKEMNQNLRYQLSVMSQTFRILKKRIEANSLQPHIQAQLAMSSNKRAHQGHASAPVTPK